jgi:hypothetical protein
VRRPEACRWPEPRFSRMPPAGAGAYRVDEVRDRAGLREQRLEALLRADVDDVALHTLAPVQACGGRLELARGRGRDDHVCAFGERRLGHGEADAGRAADDENLLACEGGHVVLGVPLDFAALFVERLLGGAMPDAVSTRNAMPQSK